jgi:hypothetical protein
MFAVTENGDLKASARSRNSNDPRYSSRKDFGLRSVFDGRGELNAGGAVSPRGETLCFVVEVIRIMPQ